MRGPRLLLDALWVLVTGVLALVGVELAVRALGLAPPLPGQYALFVEDPFLPHRLKPNSIIEGRALTGEFDFRYEHNSLGFRDREIALHKPEGTFRILGLGDSFTYGIGVAREDLYLTRLERMLNAREGHHPRVEVVNAAIPRFFPEAERLLLEHYGIDLQPDLVLVAFVPNDVTDTHLGLRAIRVLPDGRLISNHGMELLEELGPRMLLLYQRSQALRIPVRRYLTWRIQDENPMHPAEVYRAGGLHERAWEEVERQYERMLELTLANGAEFACVHLPSSGPWDESTGYPALRLAAWAERHGAVCLDALPAMGATPDPQALFWPKDLHPTAAGHELIARVVYEGLVAHHLVP